MRRRCEYKKRYNPRLCKHEYRHIYTGEILGDGIGNPFQWVVSKLSGKAAKEAATKAAEKAVTKAAEKATTAALSKTGEYAGDKIVQLLQRSKKTPTQSVQVSPSQASNELTQEEN